MPSPTRFPALRHNRFGRQLLDMATTRLLPEHEQQAKALLLKLRAAWYSNCLNIVEGNIVGLGDSDFVNRPLHPIHQIGSME